jgi:23S rRNA pseudouridine2605 synthase
MKPIIRKKIHSKTPQKTDKVRLNKYIAATGLCSRREADALITRGEISVNDVVITELGAKISAKDIVKHKGKAIKNQNLVYLLLNKPKNTVTSRQESPHERSVLDLIKKATDEQVSPVGQLDKQTTGVMLLTNDTALLEQLTDPGYDKLKIYQVTLNKDLVNSDFKKILEGVKLEDGFAKANELSYVDKEDLKQIGIEISNGRNQIVRRIFSELGYKIEKLDRVYYAGLTKKGLQRGHWRHLKKTEVANLKMGAYK